MKEEILEREKSLFKIKFMSNKEYLNNIISDDYLEIGKSGYFINKIQVIDALLKEETDRKIAIYNYSCDEIDKNAYLVHYITKNIDDIVYRTSIWKKEESLKIIFHQASILKENINLIEF